MKYLNITIFSLVGLMSAPLMAQSLNLNFCGQGGTAMFDRKDVHNCVITKDTCESDELISQGWLRSANGQCPKEPSEFQMCGMGGPQMANPNEPTETIASLNTCITSALKEMGWVEVER